MDKFVLGSVVATQRVVDELNHQIIEELIARHMEGDWGDLEDEDKLSNDYAVDEGMRILSRYKSEKFGHPELNDIYIITEADRSYTTVMFVGEY